MQTQKKIQVSNSNASILNLGKGKIPPQAIDLERTVLGGLLIDNQALDEVITILSSKFFYKTEHQLIFQAIFKLFKNNEPIDLLTVSNQLHKDGNINQIGGDIYLIELSQMVSSAAHIEYHSRILQEFYLRRKLINFGVEIADKSYQEENDVFDLLDSFYSEIEQSSEFLFIKDNEDWKTKVDSHNSFSDGNGVESTFSKFNEKGKYINSNLTIIAGRPGSGKTALIISEMIGMLKKGIKVGFFSFEMSDNQIINRMISQELNIELEKIEKHSNAKPILTYSELEEINKYKSNYLRNYPLFIDEYSKELMQFKVKTKKMVTKGVKIIFIDYLQLMTNREYKGVREQEISSISRTIKAIAKESNIPIIALSQLSRAVETRGGASGKRPQLSDLRESGAIEQDADRVLFLFRPEYYGITEFDNGEPTKDLCEVDFSKNRQGATGTTILKSEMRYTRFSDKVNDPFSWSVVIKPNEKLNNTF